MGSIFQKRGKYYISYYDTTGRRVRKGSYATKEIASLKLNAAEINVAQCQLLGVKHCEPTSFKDFAEKFRRRHIRRRNRSIRNQEYFLSGLVKHFGKKMLHEIMPNDINAYLEKRHSHNSASTTNKDITMLKSMFARANEWGDLNGHDPLKSIKKLKENNERSRYLTEEEQERLLSACSGVLRVVVLILLRQGLRWGECMNLKWQPAPLSNYVDLNNDVIFIHESLAKSKESRHIPLAPSVKQALMDFPQRSASGYIFENPKTNKPYTTLKKSFKTALRASRINDFKIHDCRHCFASDLVRKGVSLYVVQKLLGHLSPRMTKRYAHLQDDQLTQAIKVLDEKNDKIFDFCPHTVPAELASLK